MALSIYNIVNVQLNTVPKSAARKSFGTVALFTPEAGQAFNDATTRHMYVESQKDVEALFGTNSETAKAAQPFFAQSPRAKQLIIARWQKEQATIEATKNALRGATLSDDLEAFKSISNGGFSITVGLAVKVVDGLDFSEAADFNAVATKIKEKLTTLKVNADVAYDETGNRFIISATDSAESADTLIFYAEKGNATGDYIGGMLKL